MDNVLEKELFKAADERDSKINIDEKLSEKNKNDVVPQIEKPYIIYRDDFDTTLNDRGELFGKPEETVPYQVFPKIFEDERGGFSESLTRKTLEWMLPDCYHYSNIIGTTCQINRSFSKPGVMRGFHAQKAPFTQGKLVECLSNTPIWDIIIDARPNSKTYQQYALFKLDCKTMTKVWIPRGFLHGFVVPKYGTELTDEGKVNVFEYADDAQFQYFVDNEYSPESELVVNPEILLQIVLEPYANEFQKDNVKNHELYGLLRTVAEGLIYSDKDKVKYDFKDFLDDQEKEMSKGKLWYCK